MTESTGSHPILAPSSNWRGFGPSRSLRAVVRRKVFDVTVDRAFDDVVARLRRTRGGYVDIHGDRIRLRRVCTGWVSPIAWSRGRRGELVGGLYGVTIGGAFFGESMFYSVTDASKVALVHLVERMRQRGFTLLDVQFVTEHLRRFGRGGKSRDRRMSGGWRRRLRRACHFVDPTGAADTDAGSPEIKDACSDANTDVRADAPGETKEDDPGS